eukprot:GHRQ01036266.1.p1 GENE.GHRQ01036266.1~~GHRQ01036266.1.p1  ORF type:complete len:135 (-),score=7.55 GHRQ01036266.1:11-415(-)
MTLVKHDAPPANLLQRRTAMRCTVRHQRLVCRDDHVIVSCQLLRRHLVPAWPVVFEQLQRTATRPAALVCRLIQPLPHQAHRAHHQAGAAVQQPATSQAWQCGLCLILLKGISCIQGLRAGHGTVTGFSPSSEV